VPTLTAHVTDELIKEIDSVSQRLDRSRAWVVKEAVREYPERRAEDQKRLKLSKQRIAERWHRLTRCWDGSTPGESLAKNARMLID